MHIAITYIDTTDPDYRDWQLNRDQPMLICIDCHCLVPRRYPLGNRCQKCHRRKRTQARLRRRARMHKNRNRRERTQRQSEGFMRPRTWIKHQEPVCVMCGIRRTISELDVDHVKPLWAGGVNGPENYQVICKDCHRLKTEVESLWHKELQDCSI